MALLLAPTNVPQEEVLGRVDELLPNVECRGAECECGEEGEVVQAAKRCASKRPQINLTTKKLQKNERAPKLLRSKDTISGHQPPQR